MESTVYSNENTSNYHGYSWLVTARLLTVVHGAACDVCIHIA